MKYLRRYKIFENYSDIIKEIKAIKYIIEDESNYQVKCELKSPDSRVGDIIVINILYGIDPIAPVGANPDEMIQQGNNFDEDIPDDPEEYDNIFGEDGEGNHFPDHLQGNIIDPEFHHFNVINPQQPPGQHVNMPQIGHINQNQPHQNQRGNPDLTREECLELSKSDYYIEFYNRLIDICREYKYHLFQKSWISSDILIISKKRKKDYGEKYNGVSRSWYIVRE